jgi:Mrp family chromosome partitioning ATPase
LNSLEFNDLLTSLAAKYDRVILDSPPVMPVTDARILSAFCDATIIVLRADRSNRKVSAHSVDSLRGVGATILGAVVNDVSYKTGRYGYYAGYGYHSQYGPEVVVATNGEMALNEPHLNGNGQKAAAEDVVVTVESNDAANDAEGD